MNNLSVLICWLCNKKIQEGIYNSQFVPNLLTLFSAFIVLGILVAILTAMALKRHRRYISANPRAQVVSPVPLSTAAMILGIGIGGFIDGIVFHQVFQVHELLSNKIPATDYVGKSVNMFWDGIFHAFCLIVVLIGIVLLWKLLHRPDINRSGRLLTGGLLMGWALFNVVEGVIDHQILKLHNVVEFAADHRPANYIFLVASVLIGFAGAGLARAGSNPSPQFR